MLLYSKECSYVITIIRVALFFKSKDKQACCMHVCEKLKYKADIAMKISDTCGWCFTDFILHVLCVKVYERVHGRKLCVCVCAFCAFSCIQISQPSEENKRHRHSVHVSGCVSMCLCVCVCVFETR